MDKEFMDLSSRQFAQLVKSYFTHLRTKKKSGTSELDPEKRNDHERSWGQPA